jgi:hypothetical protein
MIPSLSDDQTAAALEAITARIRRHQAARARNDAPTAVAFDRLTEADKAVWRCRCGDWRYGSRDCGVCPRIVEVAA